MRSLTDDLTAIAGSYSITTKIVTEKWGGEIYY
jgi:hypothetical protein